MSSPRRGTILIIDDDPTVLSTFARIVSIDGYDVHRALDAETGLQKAETYRPDAILVDLRMPIGDGLEFLRRLGRMSTSERRLLRLSPATTWSTT